MKISVRIASGACGTRLTRAPVGVSGGSEGGRFRVHLSVTGDGILFKISAQ